MVVKYGYMLKSRTRGGGKNELIYKTRSKANKDKKAILKNNSLEKRKRVGLVGLKIVRKKLYPREIEEMKKAKWFIRK
jgi:hypothetical protein